MHKNKVNTENEASYIQGMTSFYISFQGENWSSCEFSGMTGADVLARKHHLFTKLFNLYQKLPQSQKKTGGEKKKKFTYLLLSKSPVW